jgi:peptidoglycan/LPS O-acetylase OafA/YrhL
MSASHLQNIHPTEAKGLASQVARIPELDGVRGLAAIGVVLFHAFPFVFFVGWSCVDLFFVLSGYLITTIVLTKSWSLQFLGQFYLRRSRRIWPVYFLTLIAVLILNGLSPNGYSSADWPLHAIFLQNTPKYFGIETAPFVRSFAPSWSVAIEEQFYLFWPLLILGFGRKSVPWLASALLVSCAIGRWFVPAAIDLLFTRGDGLAWGCFLAWLLWQSQMDASGRFGLWAIRVLQSTSILGAAFVVTYLMVFWGEPHPQWTRISFTGFGMLFFSLIGMSVVYRGSPYLAVLRIPLLRWFGTISYAMYMFHVPIFHFLPPILLRLGIQWLPAQIALTWICIIALPAISWYVLERPILGFHSVRERLAAEGK